MHGGRLWRDHPAVRTGSDLSFGERAADTLKARFGSWAFLIILNTVFLTEVAAHIATRGRWDAGLLLLNLFLSWLAAQQGGALQIAANRADRISAETALHTAANSDALLEVNRQQLAILTRLDSLNGQVGDLAEAVRVVMAARAEHDAEVAGHSRRAAAAAEAAFVGVQTLASVATAKQGDGAAPAPPALPAETTAKKTRGGKT